ncbi:uncharacterized protein EI90DRAFT_3150676 [Cantharellus anzutake]|uniref:uncharacterized protein n=1 Tax=Cantharellus anzutake TaxID=1750568 RepID=UPI0019082FE5|nr:uncharacterized protein EI90DRAFT_3150676 [Cantharellus anzutake]KAF8341643.1 hypothetical protein EI90DRAFT_3150676 [Cantharellus anzutake]
MFSNLTHHEKQAFFSLLDEYFESRPHLLGTGDKALENAAAAAAPAVSAVTKAVARNPQAASSLVNAGVRSFNQNREQGPKDGRTDSNNEAHTNSNSNSNAPSWGIGRVAAAASNFTGKGFNPFHPSASQSQQSTTSSDAQSITPKPPAAHAVPSPNFASRPGGGPPAADATSSASSNGRPGVGGLVTKKAIGDVNTSSTGAIFASALPKKLFGSPEPRPSATISPAFPKKLGSSMYPPPPARKLRPIRPLNLKRSRKRKKDVGDLSLKEGQRVKVLEHTSEDWWKGEADGKRGIFPASYVQIV